MERFFHSLSLLVKYLTPEYEENPKVPELRAINLKRGSA
jgi:hypothetical protein